MAQRASEGDFDIISPGPATGRFYEEHLWLLIAWVVAVIVIKHYFSDEKEKITWVEAIGYGLWCLPVIAFVILMFM